MSVPSNCMDSPALEKLRAWYIAEDRPRPATPYRLGIMAAEKRMHITDFGGHSKRWVANFHAGFDTYIGYKRISAKTSRSTRAPSVRTRNARLSRC
jgi:hypothetical protein